MTLTSLNKNLPLAPIGPCWPGVRVAVTETGFQPHGESAPTYGFNLGTHVGDCLADVEQRRSRLQLHMGAPIAWLNQVHGCDIHIANTSACSSTPAADASVATRCDVTLAIMTADCLPVLFAAFDEAGRAVGVAAAHAGWRGLHAGVLQASATALSQVCGVEMTQLKAWMGPAIGPDSFEVGQEVFDAFVQQYSGNQHCFKPGVHPGKYLADLYGLARLALIREELSQVEGGSFDTFTDCRWFSHRRGQQQGFPSGRFATLIRLLPGQAA